MAASVGKTRYSGRNRASGTRTSAKNTSLRVLPQLSGLNLRMRP